MRAAVCQSNRCRLLCCVVCLRRRNYMKSVAKYIKEELVHQFQMLPVWVSQRGGWEGHAHSHFSWCVRKISSMTQRTRGLRWRWYRVTSGAYFSTWRRESEKKGWGMMKEGAEEIAGRSWVILCQFIVVVPINAVWKKIMRRWWKVCREQKNLDSDAN